MVEFWSVIGLMDIKSFRKFHISTSETDIKRCDLYQRSQCRFVVDGLQYQNSFFLVSCILGQSSCQKTLCFMNLVTELTIFILRHAVVLLLQK